MELERVHRVVEVLVCASWITALVMRMRSVKLEGDGNAVGARIASAVRPLRTAALVATGLT